MMHYIRLSAASLSFPFTISMLILQTLTFSPHVCVTVTVPLRLLHANNLCVLHNVVLQVAEF